MRTLSRPEARKSLFYLTLGFWLLFQGGPFYLLGFLLVISGILCAISDAVACQTLWLDDETGTEEWDD